MWVKSADGKPTKEQPVKVNDHGLDALRYGVMYADHGPGEAESAPNPFY